MRWWLPQVAFKGVLTRNPDEGVARSILRECHLPVRLLAVVGGEVEVVLVLEEAQGHLGDDARAGLQVDALVRDAHQDDPVETTLGDGVGDWGRIKKSQN